MTATDSGWQLNFGYCSSCLPVVFSDGEDALTITITGRTITAFTYRCKAYAILEETSALLPASMAMAIASLHPGSGLSLGMWTAVATHSPPSGWRSDLFPKGGSLWKPIG